MSFVLLGSAGQDGSGFSLKSDSWEPTLLGSEEGLEGFYCCCACLLPVEWRIIETSYPFLFLSGPVVVRDDEEPAPPLGTGDPSYIFFGMGGAGACCFTPPYELYPGYMELQVRCENPLKPEATPDDWRTLDSWVTQYGEPEHCFNCDGYDQTCCPSGTGKIYPPLPPCCTTTTLPPPPTTLPPPTGTTTTREPCIPIYPCPPVPPPPDCPPPNILYPIYRLFEDNCGRVHWCIVDWVCAPPPEPGPGEPPPPGDGCQGSYYCAQCPPVTIPQCPSGCYPQRLWGVVIVQCYCDGIPTNTRQIYCIVDYQCYCPPTTTTTTPGPTTTTTKPPSPGYPPPGYPLSINIDDLDFE